VKVIAKDFISAENTLWLLNPIDPPRIRDSLSSELGVAAAKLSAFTSDPFGAQRVDFDCMAWFGHIAARFEFNFLIFEIATRPYFLGYCLLAHLSSFSVR